ncbi:MAG TPA: hypothetical protein VLH09_03830 [Bryobacteraceae bacterium]|nr:hypothetical protein [Bryobacteraceae bacterium]
MTVRGPRSPRCGAALGELGIILDGAMLVRDGRIVAVGQGRRVENLADARSAAEIDATGKVVLPGFVDCHTYLLPADPRAIPSRTLERKARDRVNLFVRHGTTTLEAKATQAKTLRVLAKLDNSPITAVPTYFASPAHARPGAEAEEMLPAVSRLRLARFVDVDCGRRGFRLEDARRAAWD